MLLTHSAFAIARNLLIYKAPPPIADDSALKPAAQLPQLWHTSHMVTTVNSPTERRVRKHTLLVCAGIQPHIGAAVKRVLRAGGTDSSFPTLSGAEAAALMQAAGIVTEDGKLGKKYR